MPKAFVVIINGRELLSWSSQWIGELLSKHLMVTLIHIKRILIFSSGQCNGKNIKIGDCLEKEGKGTLYILSW